MKTAISFIKELDPSCKGANYKLVIQSGASRNGGACQYADVVFTTNGYLYVKFNNYSWTIEYALSKKEKVKEDNTGGNTVGSHSKSELTGTWNMTDNRTAVTTIDSDGNIKFFHSWLSVRPVDWDYTGKISDTFDYPYTVEIVENNGGDKGTITFNSSSDATVSFYSRWNIYGGSGWDHSYGTLTKE